MMHFVCVCSCSMYVSLCARKDVCLCVRECLFLFVGVYVMYNMRFVQVCFCVCVRVRVCVC